MEFRPDILVLPAPAVDAKQRRKAMNHWLANDWAAADIGQLQRQEKPTAGWEMTTWAEMFEAVPAAPMSGAVGVRPPKPPKGGKKKSVRKPVGKSGKKKAKK